MKSVMVLGINYAQKDYLEYLKSVGYRVLAASNADKGPGSVYVDVFYRVDISDVQKIACICNAEAVAFIYSIGSAFALPFVCEISELTHKPHFITTKDALLTHKKDHMRFVLGQDTEFNVKYRKSHKYEDIDWDVYPCIVKPTDSQAQRGVRIARSKDDLFDCYQESMDYAMNGEVILEEYVVGQEYSANIYVINGEIRVMIITKRISFSEYPGGIIKEHIWEDVLYEWNDKLLEAAYLIISKFRILNGPLYIQFMVTIDLGVKIVEFTPRLDGCHLWRLIEIITGLNLMKLSTLHLLGDKVTIEELVNPRVGKRYKLAFITSKPNVIFRDRDYLKESCQNDLYAEFYYEDGDTVPASNGFIEKVGYRIMELK